MKESGVVVMESFSYGLLWLNPGARGGDHLASQLTWAAACISHMHLPCLHSRWFSPCVLWPLMIKLMV